MIGKINFVPGIGIHIMMPKAAAGKWWLAGGISPENAACAYRAINTPGSIWGPGPASKAESKLNLAIPGSYDLTEYGTLGWSSSVGWLGNNISYFSTGFNLNGCRPTIIAAVTGLNKVGTNDGLIGRTITFSIYTLPGLVIRFTVSGFEGTYTNSTAAAVVALSGGKGYVDGSCVVSGLLDPVIGSATVLLMTIGYPRFRGEMQAAAIYNTKLTAEQIAAVSSAMRQL